jgi:hypothetical protein
VDLGAGNNPHNEIRKKLRIKQFLVDIYVEDHKKDNYINENFMNFTQMEKAILSKVGEKAEAVVGLHIIEHVGKADGIKLLNNMENWAAKIVIIETPNGYVIQNGTKENPYQKHLSGWTPKELRNLGFKVTGSTGMKFLRRNSDKGKYRVDLKVVKYLDVFLSRWLGLNNIATLSFNVFAYKIIDSKISSES